VKAAVRARMNNSGQACNAAKRFIVIDKLYDDFVQKFTAAMAAIAPADPTVKGTVLGPLSSATATERLNSQVRRAVDGGAHLTGAGHEGNYFRTGVLTGVEPHNNVYREELFGPVASVFRVGSEEEAVKVANDTQFGLGSYVFTTDPEQARRVADALEAGMVCVNIVGAESAELPFGGVKQSGFGRELGRLGAGEFVNRKMIRIG
ncbi:MAG: aldehyde dehydrogenase family protein, partial [Rhodanobacteraceae bacterium]